MYLSHMDKPKQRHPPLNLSILIPTKAARAGKSIPMSTLSVFSTNYSASNERTVKTIYYRQIISTHSDQNNSAAKLGSLRDLGNVPDHLNVMAQCADKPDRLCLNMLDEHVPGKQIELLKII